MRVILEVRDGSDVYRIERDVKNNKFSRPWDTVSPEVVRQGIRRIAEDMNATILREEPDE